MKGHPGTIAPHGTNGRYVAGCTCTTCRAAHARYNKAGTVARLSGRPGLIDSTGTARRLQALACLGWDSGRIGARLGVVNRVVQQLRAQRGPTVERATAAKVAHLYDELSMRLGPSTRARTYAHRFGWAPPLAWDERDIDNPTAHPIRVHDTDYIDEIAVQRAMTGDPVTITHTERQQAILRLSALGLSDGDIATRLHITDRTVYRNRHEMGIESRWTA